MAAGDDEPMPDAPAPAPVAKPKRRFAPQLVEHTVKSSGNKKTSASDDGSTRNPGDCSSSNRSTRLDSSSSSTAASDTSRSTRDVSVQVNDIDMPDAPRPPQTKPARRFAPVPIATTFDSYRVGGRNPHGPTAEPTPEPSPTTPQSSSASFSNVSMASEPTQPKATKPKRRFAPQLIETTRRERRTGQEGPATKPTDKTDITPGTNHLYVPKPKRKVVPPPRPSGSIGGSGSPRLTHANHDSDDECSSPFLRALRQRGLGSQYTTRRSTRTNSYHPELDTILSSESGNSSDEDENGDATAPSLNLGAPALSDTRSDRGETWNTRGYELRNRRESCDEESSGYLLAVAAREAEQQREFEQALSAFPNGMRPQGVEHFFARDNSEDDVQVEDEPPLRHGPSQLLRRKSTDPGWAVKEMRAHADKLAKTHADTASTMDDELDQAEMAPPPENPLWTTTRRRHSRDSDMGSSNSPFMAARSPPLLSRSSSRVSLAEDKPVSHVPSSGGLRASPFGMPFAMRAGEAGERDLSKLHKTASPPMLGEDIKFRTCPSPQHTRMEPDQPYTPIERERPEEKQRDTSGNTGLWRGYCYTETKQQDAVEHVPLPLLHTPGDASPIDPFASAFGSSRILSGAQSPSVSAGKRGGLHMLSGLDERLKKEMERKEREKVLLAEFDDAFVTQVYNYISLGYPATARAFDDELSKISGICVQELRKDDTLKVSKGFMLRMEMNSSGSSSSSGTDSSGDETMVSPEDSERRARHKPPRWRALKLYIREWARQHPALNGGDDTGHLAWGVRARRGSWAI
ncbi:hypothetical protein F5Y18DRAFT_156017 [Xylariaceae sp. FL1019]|nr:hypothetical protein F5Y18DRAFT_156017 [Xylariaceae sp. FL1019]